MGWLGTWAYRRKITIDNTNIDSDLNQYPLPIILGSSVGKSSHDLTDIFDEVGSSSKKIAITMDDGLTQLYAEVEKWDAVNEEALIWVSRVDWSISSSSTTDLYIYFDSYQNDNTIFIGNTNEENSVTGITGDNFTGSDGDLPDSNMWIDTHHNSNSDIQNNKLNFTSNEVSLKIVGWLSCFSLSGDFDIQVDYDLTDFPQPTSDANYVTFLLFPNTGYNYQIGRYHSNTGDNGYFKQDGTNGWTSIYPYSTTSGKFRFTRSSGVITGYIWENDRWEWDGNTSGFTFPSHTGVIRIALQFWQAPGGEVNANFDNFVLNTGNVVSVPCHRVWDSSFKFVCHLNQSPTGTIYDSTFNEFQLTSSGSMTIGDLVNADIGYGIEFDGSDDYLATVSANDALNLTSTITLEALIKPASSPAIATDGLVCRHHVPNTGVDSYALFLNSSDKLQFGSYGGNIQGQALSLSTSVFTYLAGTYKSTGLSGDLFKDGVQETLSNNSFDSISGGTNSLVIGVLSPAGAEYFNGVIAEIRVSNIQRTDAYFKATSYAFKDDLLTYSTVEDLNFEAVEDVALDVMVNALAVSDFELDISVYYSSFSNTHLDILTQGFVFKNIALDTFIGLEKFNIFLLDCLVSSAQFEDAIIDMSIVDGILTYDASMDISVGDGNKIKSMGLDLMAVNTKPEFKYVYAMNLTSVIKEITS